MSKESSVAIKDLLYDKGREQAHRFAFGLFSLRLAFLLGILHFVADPNVKFFVIACYIVVFFQPFAKSEIFLFIFVNVIYFIMDAGAIQLGYLSFRDQQILGMPYYELLMWGTYYLMANRLLMYRDAPKSNIFLMVSFVFFLVAFNGISSDLIRTVLCVGILLISLFYSYSHDALKFIAVFGVIGIAVEYVGIINHEWHYPKEATMVVPLWSYVVWVASGFYFYHFWSLANFILSKRRENHELSTAK